jgi:signal transduction histidine kinase
MLNDSAEVLLPLMEDVYDLAMIEPRDMKVMNQPFDLAGMLTALVQTHASAGADSTSIKGNTLTLDLAPTLPQLVQGDANRLRQVLNHLIIRADDVSHGDKVCIQAKVVKQSSDSA